MCAEPTFFVVVVFLFKCAEPTLKKKSLLFMRAEPNFYIFFVCYLCVQNPHFFFLLLLFMCAEPTFAFKWNREVLDLTLLMYGLCRAHEKSLKIKSRLKFTWHLNHNDDDSENSNEFVLVGIAP